MLEHLFRTEFLIGWLESEPPEVMQSVSYSY